MTNCQNWSQASLVHGSALARSSSVLVAETTS